MKVITFLKSTSVLLTLFTSIGLASVPLNVLLNSGSRVSGTVAGPEINVTGNNEVIIDGDMTPSTTDATSFGATPVAGGTITRTYKIANIAPADAVLNLGAITISGLNSGDFSVSQPMTTNLNVGGQTTFSVTFDPSAGGLRTAVINIPNNDPDENPYNFAVEGIGQNPEITILGNTIPITSGDTTPSSTDHTDFGSASIDSGSTLVTFTIRNSGIGPLSVGSVTISGADAASFAVTSSPSATVNEAGSTTFQIGFNPTTIGEKTAVISVINNDADENPYTFHIIGTGVRTYIDTDGDGVSDNFDVDDDNDGILDVYEQENCLSFPYSNLIEYTFLNETFGTGTTKGLININIPGATCTYCYEDGIVGTNTDECPRQSSKILDDGEYVVTYKITGSTANDPENIHGDLAWYQGLDHTPNDVNGRMAVFNASFAPGVFYETTINGVIPNVPITYSFWALNIMAQSTFPNSILPNITVDFLDPQGNIISTFNTGNIGRCDGGETDNICTTGIWKQYTTSVNLGNYSSFIIRFKNNAPGGGGNDLALDDITIKQQYCDGDGDGIANIYDLDSDNDGIPDIEEAGFANLSSGNATMNLLASSWVDVNQNGLHDALDAMVANGTYNLPDSDQDGIVNFVDLDSDNDSLFDIDEAGIYNGDGDVDGDGVGDGIDSDGDGMLDIFDIHPGFGTAVRPLAANSDSSTAPDYIQADSDSDGIFDIAHTLYHDMDANGDGKIDGNIDIDKDGIVDTFDSSTTTLGSPRNINKKLSLDFDGRNDYALAPQMLNGLPGASLMGWIRLIDNTSGSFLFGENNFGITVSGSSEKTFSVTANDITISGGPLLETDQWYHVAAIFDGSSSETKLSLYVNGKLEASSADSSLGTTLSAGSTMFTIGRNPTSSTDHFKGSIDEVRVFGEALTQDQLQKMVYQEIQENGMKVRGTIIPKDIEESTWTLLLAYYRMDTYKGDVIDNLATSTIDQGSNNSLARIYNVKNISYQLAPMPFQTTAAGNLYSSVSHNNFVKGTDVVEYPWSILHISHDIDQYDNLTNLGLIIDQNVVVNISNDNALRNTWYLKLDGFVDLHGKSQLVQTQFSDLDPTSSGYIERDQQGTTNKFNYNYWSSPVGSINASTNNTNFTVDEIFRDGTDPANPQPINWTTALNSSNTSPITLSSYWIFKFQNLTNSYANWSSVGQDGSLYAGQGFTLKGSSLPAAFQNYTFVGKPNSGTITNLIAANNLHLSGNPFPSAIDADTFLLDNLNSLTGTIYFWEHFSTNNTHTLIEYQGGYAMRNFVGGTPPVSPSGISGLGTSSRTPGKFIPVGQGFIVTGSTTGGSIKFSNSQRAFIKGTTEAVTELFRQQESASIYNNAEDQYAEDTYARIRLGFNSANHYHRQILVGFMNDKATGAIEKGYDAIHIDDQPSDMYFMKGLSKIVIMGEGYFDAMAIYPLGVKNSVPGNVSFIIDGLENFPSDQPVYIYDNQTDQYHNLRSGPMQVNLPSGIIHNRFSLRFTGNALGLNDNTKGSEIVIAYADQQNTINIKNQIEDSNVTAVVLYNMLGQEIRSWDAINSDQRNIILPTGNLSNGTYIVTIKTTTGNLSRKISI